MDRLIILARVSIAFLWIFTAVTSSYLAPQIGYAILAQAEIQKPLATVFIYGGSLLDLLLGIWMLSGRQLALCCLVQIFIIVLYTILVSVLASDYWLHPFGPITKNLPILALLTIIYAQANIDSKLKQPT